MRGFPPLVLLCALLAAAVRPAAAQVRVSPTGVNVNSQGATTALLTFGPLNGYAPKEAMWCGTLISTAGVGARCDPTTIYGLLPARYDQSRVGPNNAYTDVMSLPESVARRAYQAAAAGNSAEFFYVRHFTKTGAPDVFVAVTCRLSGGGASVPLSLVDVTLAFDVDTPVLQVAAGAKLPALSAQLVYTGSGRLQGRWEVVLPGQELPTAQDLLTESTLSPDQRGTQHRFAEIDRFNVFLDPTGRYSLRGPDPAKLPTGVEGQYLVLLRVEASDEKESDTDLAALGVGPGVVHAGGVAGFPMPTLRYVVGGGGSELSPAARSSITIVGPADGLAMNAADVLDLEWQGVPQTAFYRVDVESAGKVVHQAFVSPGTHTYRLPPFIADKVTAGEFRWRVVSVDVAGRDGAASPWRHVAVSRRPPA